MATNMYFEEEIKDQNNKGSLTVEFGRSSYYSGSPLENGETGEDSIYLTVNGQSVVMDREMAKKFVNAASDVGHYFGLIEG